MASAFNNAASNALRIAGELVCDDHEQLLMRPEAREFAQITAAAAILAALEDEPGFQWLEGGRTDWETCCARIARRVEKGQPITRRYIVSCTCSRNRE